jgi:hypothetical protein
MLLSPAIAEPRRPWSRTHVQAKLRPLFVPLLVVCVLGSLLISAGSAAYLDVDVVPEFLLEKLPLLHAPEALWLWALRVHVVAAMFALPACVALVTGLSLWAPRLHRWLGRVTGVVVVVALVPAGFVLALEAKGGPFVGAGFVLSGVIVLWGMVRGVTTARQKRFVAHKNAVWHVLAQLSVAVTSRALLVGADAVGVDAAVAYAVALWVPVLGSAALVEVFVPARRDSLEQRSPHASLSPRVVVLHRFAGAGR